MNLGGGSSSPLSRARDYSDVMLMRMATKEISRWRGGGERRGWGREREEDGGEKGGERAEWWVAAHSALIPHSLFPVASRCGVAIKRTPPSRTYLLGRVGHLHINTPMMKQRSEATPEGISRYKTITANTL